jgi:hypothetical protein
MASKIQIRRDTSANWISNNPILSLGEIGIETDTGTAKYGDGLTAWTSLTYSKINPSTYTALTTLASADMIPVYDSSASDLCYITCENLGICMQYSPNVSTTLATDDTFAFYDTSASNTRKITASNLLANIINNSGLLTTAETSDYVVLYDTSASLAKKITTLNLANTLHTNSTPMSVLASNDTICAYDTSATTVGQITVANLETSLATLADSIPTIGSTHLITSSGLYDAIAGENFIKTPPTPAVRYSFDDMPDLPDDSGADFKSTYFIAVPSGWVANSGTPVSTFANGIWHIVCDGDAEGYYHSIGASRIFVCLVKCTTGTITIYKDGVLQSYKADNTWHKFNYYNVTAGNIILLSNSGTFDVSYVYIGDGTTSQPIIDNVSGDHNSTAQSGVVSTTGVSGKACQFLGYKALQLDLSKYASVQSWWISLWIYLDVLPNDTKYVFYGGAKDYLAISPTLFYSQSNNGSVNLTSQTVSSSSLLSGWHNIVVANKITSTTVASKELLIDGVSTGIKTSSADFTNLNFAGCYIGGSSISVNLLTGTIDDFQFSVGEITAPQALGLYLQRASAAKLYTLSQLMQDTGGSYGTCSTAAGTAAKTVTVPYLQTLVVGACIKVYMTYSNTASGVTLNVNSLGAVAVYKGTSQVGSGDLIAGYVYILIYDGTYWRLSA